MSNKSARDKLNQEGKKFEMKIWSEKKIYRKIPFRWFVERVSWSFKGKIECYEAFGGWETTAIKHNAR